MISEPIKQRLRDNWGEKADAMDCYCEVKYIWQSPPFSCYIFALDPQDDDTIACIIEGYALELCDWSLRDLKSAYNAYGEPLELDTEYRKIKASTLYKKLKGDT